MFSLCRDLDWCKEELFSSVVLQLIIIYPCCFGTVVVQQSLSFLNLKCLLRANRLPSEGDWGKRKIGEQSEAGVTAGKVGFYRSENTRRSYAKCGIFQYFSVFTKTENPIFSASFRVGELEYSFHYPAVFCGGERWKTHVFWRSPGG